MVAVFIVLESKMSLSPMQSKMVAQALKFYKHYVERGTPHAKARKDAIEDCMLSKSETKVLDSAIEYQGKGVVES